MHETEHQAQVAIFRWARLYTHLYPELTLMYAIPNAGQRSYRAGRWMVAEGLRKGIPDICLPCPRGSFHALYIELKVGSNKPTEDQQAWMERLCQYGNLAIPVWGSRNAIEVIKDYIGWNEDGD